MAIKILTDLETKACFTEEARLSGSLSHDNVIHFYEYGEEDGRPYIVMELLRGETAARCDREGVAQDDMANRARNRAHAAGFTLGTPYCLPPEQVQGRPITHRIDIYAFGAVLLELAHGHGARRFER